MFLLLLVGGILGICGLKKKNFHCHFVMFFFILTVEGMATNVALNVQGIYMALSTNDDASLSDRYLVARDIEKVADLANSNFCSSVTGMCPCNLTNTAYYTQTSANPVP